MQINWSAAGTLADMLGGRETLRTFLYVMGLIVTTIAAVYAVAQIEPDAIRFVLTLSLGCGFVLISHGLGTKLLGLGLVGLVVHTVAVQYLGTHFAMAGDIALIGIMFLYGGYRLAR
jgi:hypothetical protein